ncbi:hypothetical protein [Mycobacterium paraense]|uniref:hypothetical protein n=1 Tax=Mycobacterium paraense TaxID=767916 RepID=UPI00111C73FD|nr:hypothetical protein [Mycobacterium paraense]
MGEVETAVREQCAAADARGDNQAGIKAAAIKLAKLIDDPECVGQAGQNIAKLQRLLDALGPPKRKMKGHNTLATVSAMAGKRRAQ